jgi:hypothetical protein
MRTETTTRTLYTFNELSEEAQEAAVEGWVEHTIQHNDGWWSEYPIDSAVEVAALMGWDLQQKRTTKGDGSIGWANSVWWSGFACQGDGASFDGHCGWLPGCVTAVKTEWPKDETLSDIASRWTALQRRYFYRLEAHAKNTGRYCHELEMDITLEYTGADCREVLHDDWEEAREILRDFARWIYNQLEEAWDYETSEENAREYLENGEDEFTEEGEMV